MLYICRRASPIICVRTTQSATQTTQSATQSPTQTTQSTAKDIVQAIITLIQQEPSLSQKELAQKLHLNENTLKYHIRKMREKGTIERTGSNRSGRWFIK